jgi:hypothetical protein
MATNIKNDLTGHFKCSCVLACMTAVFWCVSENRSFASAFFAKKTQVMHLGGWSAYDVTAKAYPVSIKLESLLGR